MLVSKRFVPRGAVCPGCVRTTRGLQLDFVQRETFAAIPFYHHTDDFWNYSNMPVAVHPPVPVPSGIKSYYQAKIEVAELTINRKTQNLRRLEAQRNALNARGM
jgi:hypothetical protein